MKAATKHIPFKKINTIKEVQDKPSTKKSLLFYRYKQIQYLKNHFSSPNFNSLLLNYLSQYPENSLPTNNPSIIQIKNKLQLIKSALNHEYQQNLYNKLSKKSKIATRPLLRLQKFSTKKY